MHGHMPHLTRPCVSSLLCTAHGLATPGHVHTPNDHPFAVAHLHRWLVLQFNLVSVRVQSGGNEREQPQRLHPLRLLAMASIVRLRIHCVLANASTIRRNTASQ